MNNRKPFIIADQCTGCEACVEECPRDCIDLNNNYIAILAKPEECDGCGICAEQCPAECIVMISHREGNAPLEVFIQDLKSDDENVRLAAAERLGELEDPRAIEPLIEALKGEEQAWMIRTMLDALKQIGSPAIEPLGNLIKSEEFYDLELVAETLMDMGASARELLITLFEEGCENVKLSVVFSIGHKRDKRAVGPLLKALKEGDDSIKRNAAHALADIGDKESAEPLIGLLSLDENDLTRELAIEVLGKVRDKSAVGPLIEALKDKSKDIMVAAIAALRRLQDRRAVEPIIEMLHEKDELIRSASIDALGAFKIDIAADPLLEALPKEGKENREKIIKALEKIDPKKAKEAKKIAEEIKSEEQDVSRLKSEDNVEAIFDLLANWETDIQLKRDAAKALEEIGTESLERIYSLIADPEYADIDEDALTLIAELLNKFGEPSIVKLIETIDDENLSRTLAIRLAGAIRNPSLVQPLIGALSDDELFIDRGVDSTHYAEEALVEIGDPAVDQMIEALRKEDNEEARQYLIDGLGKIGDKRAADAITPYLGRIDDGGIPTSAVIALGRIGSPESIEPLVESLSGPIDDMFREEAVTALAQMGKGAVEPMKRALKELIDEGEIGEDEIEYHQFTEAIEMINKGYSKEELENSRFRPPWHT